MCNYVFPDMKKGYVSVIIAAYNSEQYISECLDSVCKSKYEKLDIIVIDDGSEDRTRLIVSEYAKRDNRIRLFSKENGGPSSARNLALQYCIGEFITIVDSDDYINENTIFIAVSQLGKTNSSISLYDIIMDYNGIFENLIQNDIGTCYDNITALKMSIDWKIPGLGVFRRNLFDGIAFRESNIHGDELTIRELIYKSLSVVTTNAKYYYRDNGNSISRAFSLKRFGILDNNLLVKDFLEKKGIFELCKEEFISQYIKCIVGCSSLYENNKSTLTTEEMIFSRKIIKSHIKIMRKHFSFKVIMRLPLSTSVKFIISCDYHLLMLVIKFRSILSKMVTL